MYCQILILAQCLQFFELQVGSKMANSNIMFRGCCTSKNAQYKILIGSVCFSVPDHKQAQTSKVEVWCKERVRRGYCGSSLADHSMHSRCTVEQLHWACNSSCFSHSITNTRITLTHVIVLMTPPNVTVLAMNMPGQYQ